jgi:MFS family permease
MLLAKPRSNLFGLSRPVWLLGWVSLATDAATEAIYPLLPFFLTQVLGAGAVSLGIIEGAAEATNSALKIFAGRLADRSRSKRPIVLVGYVISSAVRPLVAVAQTWTHVFAVRVLDRVGKGIRGAPRDAMLASLATQATRGKVYGFHRAMDHSGAVLGPTLATAFLFFYPGEYRTLFSLTIIPGAIAVGLIFFVTEAQDVVSDFNGTRQDPTAIPVASDFSRTSKETDAVSDLGRTSDVSNQIRREPNPTQREQAPPYEQVRRTTDLEHRSAEPLPRRLKGFFLILALFTLGNSTDAFLLLKLTDVAGSIQFIPLMWAALHVVKAAISLVGGSWSDRIGRRAVIALGWVVYAVVYSGFALSTSLPALLAWFLLYGFYFGLTEGTEKALVADLAPGSRRGFAFGVYNAVLGVGGLAASIVFGLVWTAIGPAAAFGLGAALALVSSALLFVVVPRST